MASRISAFASSARPSFSWSRPRRQWASAHIGWPGCAGTDLQKDEQGSLLFRPGRLLPEKAARHHGPDVPTCAWAASGTSRNRLNCRLEPSNGRTGLEAYEPARHTRGMSARDLLRLSPTLLLRAGLFVVLLPVIVAGYVPVRMLRTSGHAQTGRGGAFVCGTPRIRRERDALAVAEALAAAFFSSPRMTQPQGRSDRRRRLYPQFANSRVFWRTRAGLRPKLRSE